MTVFVKTALLLILTTNVFAQQNPSFKKELFVSSNDSLPYRLAYPVNYSNKQTYPLVLFLHGSGQRGNDNEVQLSNVALFMDSLNRIKYPCFILVPQCPKKDVWVNFPGFPNSIAATDTPTTSAKLVLTLIGKLTKELPINKNRIYITGPSMGGEGTFDFLTRRPDLFAAAVPLCSVADTSKAKYIKHVPVWAFHGDEDNVNDVKYSRMMVAALKAAGGNPRYTEYKGVQHNCWTKAYAEPELLPWLFSNERNKPVR